MFGDDGLRSRTRAQSNAASTVTANGNFVVDTARLDGSPAEPAVSTTTCELSIVLPCLNEAETLETCIRKAQRSLESLGVTGEVIVADNGSTDGSQEIARRPERAWSPSPARATERRCRVASKRRAVGTS